VSESGFNLERKLAWAILLLLLGGCLLVLLPFLPAFLWALVLCVALWPIYARLLRLLRQRRTLAALIMSLAMVLVILIPVLAVADKLVDSVNDVALATAEWVKSGPPPPPGWLRTIPAVGEKAADRWQNLANDSRQLLEKSKAWLPVISAGLLKLGLLVTTGLLQITLSLFVTFFLLRDAEALRDRLRSAAARIAGERGLHLLSVAGDTIRGVVYGILGTALLQAVMAGAGFLVAGVPGAAVLALLLFFLSVIPLGPALIFLPVAFWLFHEGQTGWGIFMIIWGLIVSSVDNFVKPWLISQGSKMPFLLIFFGVIGGALTFGLIGAFLGPTLLAVGFRLVEEWSVVQPGGATPEGQAL
jgi:predicted PurR-regulated permease PerM